MTSSPTGSAEIPTNVPGAPDAVESARKPDAVPPAPATSAAGPMTTATLIERLQALDPEGTRTVFVEINRDPTLDTDYGIAVYVEDGNATWDEHRNRLVITNDREAAGA